MPAVLDHAANYPSGAVIGPRNGDMIPRDIHLRDGGRMSPPLQPKPIHVRPPVDYAFPGLPGFLKDAAKRDGFGDTSEEASLLNKITTEYTFKRANESISHASRQSDPSEIDKSLVRARLMRRALALTIQAIDDAIADRQPEPSLIVTPEDTKRTDEHIFPLGVSLDQPIETRSPKSESIETPTPEITDHGSRQLRSRKPGKLGGDVQ